MTLSILTNSATMSLPPLFWFTRSINAGGKLCSCPKRIPIFFIGSQPSWLIRQRSFQLVDKLQGIFDRLEARRPSQAGSLTSSALQFESIPALGTVGNGQETTAHALSRT